MSETQSTARAELIRDLRAFADLLEARPDLPVDERQSMYLQHSLTDRFGSESERIAEVERIAALLGVEVDRDHRLVVARLDLGRIQYKVATSTDHGHALFDAEHSYHGAVEPELVGA